jgi:hypothetical protein
MVQKNWRMRGFRNLMHDQVKIRRPLVDRHGTVWCKTL